MPEHVKALQKARTQLVNSRRALVEHLEAPDQRATFIQIQSTIEQIDKAIADENLIGATTPLFGERKSFK
jgi:hypothetical protein